MRTTDLLRREHRLIASMLQRLEEELARVRRRGSLRGSDLDTLLTFFHEEVDGHHQEKEERVLLHRLLLRVRGGERRLVVSLLEEHREERRSLEVVRGMLEDTARGEPLHLDRLVFHVKKYLQAQREHMRKEEAVLFPLVESALSPDDDHAVVAGFRRVRLLRGAPLTLAAGDTTRLLDAG